MYLSAQIDTLTIKDEIDELTTLEGHRQYLQGIIDIDQKYRGSQTVESLDKLNLIKAICYFNRHGYPSGKTLGKYNGGVTLPFIHNSLPGVELLSFSIIMEGFRNGEIDELTFREGYLRPFYHRKYGYKPFERDGPNNPNNIVRNGSLQSLLQDLNLGIEKTISLILKSSN